MTSNNPHPESDILAEHDPSITHSNDWPEFQLHDALGTLPDSGDCEPVSLLIASEYHPVTITGRLEPPSREQAHLYLRKDGGKKGTPIVIEDVRSFAYGAYGDGSVELWAAGKAGWFVLRPGRAYRKTYQDMCQAVKTLFFVADAYSETVPTKKGRNTQTWSAPSVEELFEKYAREELGDETKSDEAAEALYQHRDFLMSSMLAGKEGMAWGKNPLFRHLANKFADNLKEIRERSARPIPQKPGSKLVKHARQASLDTQSTRSSLKRKRGRPIKHKSVDVISIGSSSAASSRKKDVPQRPRTRSDSQQSKGVPKSGSAPTRRTRNNSQALPRSETPEIQDSATPAQDSDSDEGQPRYAGKGKSVLRLKPNKATKGPSKGATQDGKASVEENDEPRSSPLPSKRRRGESPGPRHAKRRNSKAEALDEGIDMPSSPSLPSSPDTAAGAPSPLADSLAAHKPDPVQESTWVCALDGCMHKIYGDPSDPVSQRLIREHYALHAYDDDARVQLVKRLQAPSLPVRHLMEKVKVAAKGEGFPGSKVAGTRFPELSRSGY